MQHIWAFQATINGKEYRGELVTDKSRKSKIPAAIEKKFSLKKLGEVEELVVFQLR